MEADTKNFIEQALIMQKQSLRKDFEFGVIRKEDGQFVGGCGIHVHQSNAEIGYCFHSNYWGQGYATEAALEMLKFGFFNLGVHRIYATCRPENVGSAKVMERIGMQREGRLREHVWYKGDFHDSYLYSILLQDFEQRSKS